MSTTTTSESMVSNGNDGNEESQEIAQENQKIAQKSHRWKLGEEKKLGAAGKAGAAKTSAAYWMAKVKKPAGSGLFGVQIEYRGNRHRFPLETANQATAAEKARRIYLHLVANGAQATLEEFNPKSAPKPAAPPTVATVGQLIEAATRLSSARRESLDAYSKALRRITTGVMGVKGGKKGPKHGTDAWREMIDATPLDNLTPAGVLAWKNAFLKSAANPQERNSAAVTVNSLLRNSKALLSKKVRSFVEAEIALPSPLWFESVPMEKEPSMRYHSIIDAGTILRAAMDELAPEKPEAFKALILTLVCGLRRSEADSMQWAQVNLDAGTMEIMDTEHRALKSADSAGKIALDTEVVALLRGFKARTKSPFILETPKLARAAFKEHKSRTYRCDATHTVLIEWLRKHGMSGKRPIHTLRKEIGSIIASREGIFAASRYLRHSDIRITSRLYADTKTLVSAGLGILLSPAPETVIAANFQSQPDDAAQPKPKAKPALQTRRKTPR